MSSVVCFLHPFHCLCDKKPFWEQCKDPKCLCPHRIPYDLEMKLSPVFKLAQCEQGTRTNFFFKKGNQVIEHINRMDRCLIAEQRHNGRKKLKMIEKQNVNVDSKNSGIPQTLVPQTPVPQNSRSLATPLPPPPPPRPLPPPPPRPFPPPRPLPPPRPSARVESKQTQTISAVNPPLPPLPSFIPSMPSLSPLSHEQYRPQLSLRFDPESESETEVDGVPDVIEYDSSSSSDVDYDDDESEDSDCVVLYMKTKDEIKVYPNGKWIKKKRKKRPQFFSPIIINSQSQSQERKRKRTKLKLRHQRR